MPRPFTYIVNVVFFVVGFFFLFFTRNIVSVVLTVVLIGFLGIVGMNIRRRGTIWVDLI